MIYKRGLAHFDRPGWDRGLLPRPTPALAALLTNDSHRAKVTAATREAPAVRSALAHGVRIAPASRTTSMRSALRGAAAVARTSGRRAAHDVFGPPRGSRGNRSRQCSTGASTRFARAVASSAAGSKSPPRGCDRVGGTGTIVPLSMCLGASRSMRSAIKIAAGRSCRNLSAPTRSRATPSYGAEDQARSSPAGPPPKIGSTSRRLRLHGVQIPASCRCRAPQATQSAGAVSSCLASSTSGWLPRRG
jgi:hypothetical protein